MNKHSILIVEDDDTIRKFINASLSTQGYIIKEAINGKEGISLAMSHSPDVILLDLGLGDMDGLDVIKNIRNLSDVPIIVVLARVRVAIRHSEKNKPKVNSKTDFEHKGLFIDFEKRKVSVDGEEIHLTPSEYDILSLLVKYHGKVLTHNFIAKEIWGSALGSEIKSLRVFMATLRRKIEKEPANPEYIITEIGVGYKLNDE